MKKFLARLWAGMVTLGVWSGLIALFSLVRHVSPPVWLDYATQLLAFLVGFVMGKPCWFLRGGR